jgi:membrane protein implicated in regulation of membrane protease activity
MVPPSGKSTSTASIDYFKQTAIVTNTIRPYRPGQIFFQGSWWRAVCEQNIELPVNTLVCVVDLKNITYIVKPIG